jgi:hypothetical protein
MLGVSHTTVDRDTGTNVPTVEQKAEEDQSEGGTNVPRAGTGSGITTTGIGMYPYAERGVDLYETPPPVVHALLAAEPLPPGVVWEPACGPGAIVRVLREAGHPVVATDLIDYGCPDSTGGIDFLKQQSAPEGVTAILTNPPYKHANEFVRLGLKLVPRVVLLLPLWFEAGVERSDIIDSGQLARVYVFRNRLPMMHRAGWTGPRIESSAMLLAWYIWDRHHRGPTELWRISWKTDEEPADDVADGRDIAEAAE